MDRVSAIKIYYYYKNSNHNNITLHDINVKRSEKGKMMFVSVQYN